MVVIMVGWLTTKVKQPLLTAVCRELRIDWVAALDPGGSSAIDVDHVPIPERLQIARRRQAALTAVTDRKDRPVPGNLGHPLLQLPKRDQLRARNVAGDKLPRLPDIEQEGPWIRTQSLAQL
jgi:hypothetical protein